MDLWRDVIAPVFNLVAEAHPIVRVSVLIVAVGLLGLAYGLVAR